MAPSSVYSLSYTDYQVKTHSYPYNASPSEHEQFKNPVKNYPSKEYPNIRDKDTDNVGPHNPYDYAREHLKNMYNPAPSQYYSPPAQYDSLPNQEDTYLTNDTPPDHHAQVLLEFDKYDPYSNYEGKPYSTNQHEDTSGHIHLSHNVDMEKEAQHLEERVSNDPFSETPVNYDYFEDDYSYVNLY